MERLLSMPESSSEEQFVLHYRRQLEAQSSQQLAPPLQKDDKGVAFSTSDGRKTSDLHSFCVLPINFYQISSIPLLYVHPNSIDVTNSVLSASDVEIRIKPVCKRRPRGLKERLPCSFPAVCFGECENIDLQLGTVYAVSAEAREHNQTGFTQEANTGPKS